MCGEPKKSKEIVRARLFSKVNRVSLPKVWLWLKVKLISQLRFLKIQRRKINRKGGILKQTSWLRSMTSVSWVFEVFSSRCSAMKSGWLLLLKHSPLLWLSPSSNVAEWRLLGLCWFCELPAQRFPQGQLCSAAAAAPLTWMGSPWDLSITLCQVVQICSFLRLPTCGSQENSFLA